MKAGRRKELKTNELIQSLIDLGQSIRQYAVQIVIVIVVAALVLGLGAYWRSAKASRLHAGWAQLTRLMQSELKPQTINGLRLLAVEHADPALSAAANQLLGDALMDQVTTGGGLMADAQREAALSEAESAYQRTTEIGTKRSASRGVAMIGLGKVAEQRGQWDTTRERYQAVIDDADLPQAYKGQAQIAIDKLDILITPVVFVDAPAEEPAEASPAPTPTVTVE